MKSKSIFPFKNGCKHSIHASFFCFSSENFIIDDLKIKLFDKLFDLILIFFLENTAGHIHNASILLQIFQRSQEDLLLLYNMIF